MLHGTFALLRQLQCHRPLAGLALSEAPKIQRRILDHWDNLDGNIERGYAGKSLWQWSALPGTLSQRYTDYARANASIGINGAVLNNVNADAQILTSSNLDKVAALATVFRPYGIAVYLSAHFGAPHQIGGLNTADPSNSAVKTWWVNLADTIYTMIPDFGGFLVKANSEGQPGPQTIIAPMPTAPTCSPEHWLRMTASSCGGPSSTATTATTASGRLTTSSFRWTANSTPHDGASEKRTARFPAARTVQPAVRRHAQNTSDSGVEITKEYLGEDTHLAYLGPMWKEVLESDTYAKGQGSTVARVIDGSLFGYKLTAMAGVPASVPTRTGAAPTSIKPTGMPSAASPGTPTARAASPTTGSPDVFQRPAFVPPVMDMMMGSRRTG